MRNRLLFVCSCIIKFLFGKVLILLLLHAGQLLVLRCLSLILLSFEESFTSFLGSLDLVHLLLLARLEGGDFGLVVLCLSGVFLVGLD